MKRVKFYGRISIPRGPEFSKTLPKYFHPTHRPLCCEPAERQSPVFSKIPFWGPWLHSGTGDLDGATASIPASIRTGSNSRIPLQL